MASNVTEIAEDHLPDDLVVTPMGDEEFATYGELLPAALDGRDAFNALHAKVFWDISKADVRVPVVVKVLLEYVIEAHERHGTDFEKVVLPGVLVLDALWKISLDPSWDTVCVRRGRDATAPCVLLPGFAGSNISELQHQIDCYSKVHGFTVIYWTACKFPESMAQRQNARIAFALKETLQAGCKNLMFHACSGHGLSSTTNIMRLWMRDDPPFDDLPPLKDLLGAIVHECWGPHGEDFYTYHDDYFIQDPIEFMRNMNVHDRDFTIFLMASHNCLKKMCDTYTPEIRWYALPTFIKSDILRYVAPPIQNRFADKHGLGLRGARQPTWDGYEILYELNRLMAPNGVPHLLLYGTNDALFAPENMEWYSDALYAEHRKVKQLCVKIAKAEHMKLWEVDIKACKKAVADLVKLAKFPKMK